MGIPPERAVERPDEPFANLSYVYLSTDGFNEQGGSTALSAASDDTRVTLTTLGIRGSTAFVLAIGRAYGMIDEDAQDSSAVRASYFIDPEGIIRAISWYPMTVGRSADEMLRLAAALKRVEAGDAVTPEGWRPGEPVLSPFHEDTALADTGADWFCRRIEGS